MNLFDVVNEELKRMTEERDWWLKQALTCGEVVDKYGHKSPHPNQQIGLDKYKEIGKEILEVRKKIFDQIEDYDKKVQEKIAELALTGSAE